MPNTCESANQHPVLNNVLDKLVENRFFLDNRLFDKVHKIPFEELRQANWLASILSLSSNESHQQKALTFATLAYLQNTQDLNFERNCYVIQSRTGNIPAGRHLHGLMNEDYFAHSFGTMLDFELSAEKDKSVIQFYNNKVIVTKFQRELWAMLHNSKNIAISAPTSAGKSFIIQSYITEQCIKETSFRAVYIVPSRALIYQISSKFKEILRGHDVVIRTGFGYDHEDMYPMKEVIVVTPERALKLIEIGIKNNDYNIDFVFIDEIQNIEDKGRGILFEYVIQQISKRWRYATFATAGPFIKSSDRILLNLDVDNVVPWETTQSPVFQIKIILRFSKQFQKGLEAYIFSPTGKKLEQRIDIPAALYSKVKNNVGSALSEVINIFGLDSKNIIYSPRPNSAEKWALKMIENRDLNYIPSERVSELIEYLEEEVHPKYSLIRCLRKGLAFHHAGLPDIARTEIEEIYSSDNGIQNIFCTSTLLEGVNLPAQKMFIIRPSAGDSELSYFDFNNLIGRAGRISEHLYGAIYCIETEDEPWGEDKIVKDITDTVVMPASDRTLTEQLEELQTRIIGQPEVAMHDQISRTISLLRHKFIQNEEECIRYLQNREVPKQNLSKIIISFKSQLRKLSIPLELVRLNPTIDPLLQDKFYKDVVSTGVSKWIITTLPFHMEEMIPITEIRMLPFEKRNFYGQFELVAERLNSVFNIESEVNSYSRESIKEMVRNAVPWLRGKPYKAIIDRELRGLTDEQIERSVDKVIRRVTKSINQYVRFLLVKYFKLWSDVIKTLIDESDQEKYKYILNLHNMLEMGADNPKALELISKGITRTVALEIVRKLPSNYTGDIEEWLTQNARSILPHLYTKHLQSLGYVLK